MKIKMISGLFFLSLVILIAGCSNNVEELDQFAQCLTDSGATMYGTEWCSHCQNQKAMFGNSFELIDYVDCDRNSNECSNAGVQGYPTWNVDNKNYPGEQSLNTLSTLTGCKLE